MNYAPLVTDDALRQLLEVDERIGYALLFGSVARGRDHARSDVDIAIGLRPGARLTTHELGDLASRLESVAGRAADLVLLDDAPPALAYRVFRDGRILFDSDRHALVARKASAILEYLDFRLCTRGVLAAAARGR